jgi:hypothetical protein
MSLHRFSLVALLAVCPLVSAQDQDPVKKADESIFHKAFYLDRGARDYEAAAPLYRSFLTANADSKLAPEAARSLVQLLHRVGKSDEANALAEQYSGLLKKATDARREVGSEGAPERGGDRRAGRRGGETDAPAGDRPPMDAEALAAATKELEDLKAQLAKAKESGDEEAIADLERQVSRTERRLQFMRAGGPGGMGGGGPGRGGQGRGGRGFGGLGTQKPFVDMTDEERSQWLENSGDVIGRMTEMLRNNGSEENANKVEAAFKKVSDLVKENKHADADKEMTEATEMIREMFRRR